MFTRVCNCLVVGIRAPGRQVCGEIKEFPAGAAAGRCKRAVHAHAADMRCCMGLTEWRRCGCQQDLLLADAIVLGAPGRQGGMCGEMRLFLDSLAHLQIAGKGSSSGLLKACARLGQGWAGLCMVPSL